MMDGIVLHFPWLDAKLVAPDTPDWVHCFDPGVEMSGARGRWRSPELPFTDVEVRRLLLDYQKFGEQFRKTTDMQAYQAAGLDNFYTDTTMDIVSQLTGANIPTQEDPVDRRKQAQLVLAMALMREEQFVSIREQGSSFERAREGFALVLGLDDEETFQDLSLPDEMIFSRASVDLPWKGVLPSLLLFLPEGGELFVSDPDVLGEFRASALAFAPCDRDGEAFMCCHLDAEGLERLCGQRLDLRCPVRILARPENL